MTDRIPLDHLTSDQYDALCDQLDALRKVARGYCPACGRGDAAPTVEDWERERQRADRAEAEIAACRKQQWPQQLAHAEAAIARVRAIAGWAANGWSDLSPDKILAALDESAPTTAPQTTDDQEQP